MQLPEKYKVNFDVSSEGHSRPFILLALPTLAQTVQDFFIYHSKLHSPPGMFAVSITFGLEAVPEHLILRLFQS
jgi:hypothetical protein